jgi:hypothetical protein
MKTRGKPFPKGTSGNPKGRPKKGESITDLMRRLLNQKYETKEKGKRKQLKEIFCNEVIAKALNGDINAIKLVWNYIDGMPTQKIEGSGLIEQYNLSQEEYRKIRKQMLKNDDC